MTVSEALSAVAAYPVRRAAIARVRLGAALGLTLSSPVRAVEDVPPFARSRVDGYAVVAADVVRASKERPVRLSIVGDIAMGASAQGSIGTGRAMRIPTGGALPNGADGAVMVEDTAESNGVVEVYEGAEAPENVTLAGADVRTGTELFATGTVLTPAKIGLLAGAGIGTIDVYEPPRVALLMTGDELVSPDSPVLTGGQIRDINRYSLGAALTAMGFSPQQYDRVPDDRSDLRAAFSRALAQCDAVVISGGSSAGERDYTPEVVAEAGKPGVIVHHIRAKPGRPTLLGLVGDQPVIGLPGNPVSALVMLETVGKPILLRMLDRVPRPVPWRATLAAAIDVSPHLEHRIPVRLRVLDGSVRAEPLIGTSAQMHTLGFADGFVVVPLRNGRIEAESIVDAWPFTTGLAAE